MRTFSIAVVATIFLIGAWGALAPRPSAVGAGEPPAAAPPLAGEGPAAAPAPPRALGPAAPALAGLGDGSAVCADGEGRLFHLRSSPEGLTISAAYVLRFDRARHLADPARRSPHGWYLDDLGREALDAFERAKEAFLREVRSGAVDAGASARAERRAREVLAAGDATFLLEMLRDPRYGTRRAAAFALGEAGFREARPALGEVLTEREGDGAERARRVLDKLSGK